MGTTYLELEPPRYHDIDPFLSISAPRTNDGCDIARVISFVDAEDLGMLTCHTVWA